MSRGRFDSPIVAALTGFLDLFRPQPLSARLTEGDSFNGKTVVITGANSGLGFALAEEAARRDARVIVCARRQLDETVDKVRRRTGSLQVSGRRLDLSNIESIHAFVEALALDGVAIDVLYLNAATTLPEARQLDNGQDEMFFVNYLANFVLVNLLLQCECIVPGPGQPRIVFVSSDSHQGASAIDYDEFGRYFEYGVSKAINNYSYFKLVLNTFAVELSHRLNRSGVGAQVNVICPGPVNSNIIKEAPLPLRIVLRGIFTLIFSSPRKAALPVIYLGISSDFDDRTGEYLHMFRLSRMDEKVYQAAEREKLWRESARLWRELDAGAPH